MATRNEINTWLMRGKDKGNSHMLVVCDTWDYEDYPVYVKAEEDVNKVFTEHSINMQRVMEVYNYRLPLLEQIEAARVFNL